MKSQDRWGFGAIAGIVVLILGVTLPIAASIYLDAGGAACSGEVISKVEWIEDHLAKAFPQFEVTFKYQVRGEDWGEADVMVDEDTYDRLTPGSHAELRCQAIEWMRELDPWIPAVRVRGQNNWEWMRLKTNTGALRLFLTLAGAIPFLMLAARLKGFVRAAAPILIYLILAGIYWLTPVSEPAPSGSTAITLARVRKIHRVAEVLEGRSSSGFVLMAPVELVELEFVPRGRVDPVVAVDRITAGSFAGLKEEGQVEITYQADRPRVARMSSGRRDYGLANVGTLVMPWVVGFLFVAAAFGVLIGVIFAYAKLFRRA